MKNINTSKTENSTNQNSYQQSKIKKDLLSKKPNQFERNENSYNNNQKLEPQTHNQHSDFDIHYHKQIDNLKNNNNSQNRKNIGSSENTQAMLESLNQKNLNLNNNQEILKFRKKNHSDPHNITQTKNTQNFQKSNPSFPAQPKNYFYNDELNPENSEFQQISPRAFFKKDNRPKVAHSTRDVFQKNPKFPSTQNLPTAFSHREISEKKQFGQTSFHKSKK